MDCAYRVFACKNSGKMNEALLNRRWFGRAFFIGYMLSKERCIINLKYGENTDVR